MAKDANKFGHCQNLQSLITECKKKELLQREKRKNKNFQRFFWELPINDENKIPNLKSKWQTNLSKHHLIQFNKNKMKFEFKQFNCSCSECISGYFSRCKSEVKVFESYPENPIEDSQCHQEFSDSETNFVIDFTRNQSSGQNRNPDCPIFFEMNVNISEIEETAWSLSLENDSDFKVGSNYGDETIDKLFEGMNECDSNIICLTYYIGQILYKNNDQGEVDVILRRLGVGQVNSNDTFIVPIFSNPELCLKKSVDQEKLENAFDVAEGHWCLIVISLPMKKVLYIDSLGANNSYVSEVGLKDFVLGLKNTLRITEDLDFTYVNSQKQTLNDCGPLTLSYAELIVTHGVDIIFEDIRYDSSFVRKIRLVHSNLLHIDYYVPKIEIIDKQNRERVISQPTDNEINPGPPLNSSTPTTSRKRPSVANDHVPPKRKLTSWKLF